LTESKPVAASAKIFVGPIWALEKAAEIGARHAVTLINGPMMADIVTPPHIEAQNHLRLIMNDIDRPAEGLIAPEAAHVERLVAFLGRWDHHGPLLIHCLAGISRSPAAVFIALCALNPGSGEGELALRLREGCPAAKPNRLLIRLGDEVLGRDGRMIAACAAMTVAPPLREGPLCSVAV
jgi:predicted protein tyrosine phosphatase